MGGRNRKPTPPEKKAQYNANKRAKFMALPEAERHAIYQARWKKYKGRYKVKSSSRRKWDLKRHYGITPEQFEAMYAAQGGICPICDRHMPKGKGKHCAYVDHDHDTNEVRGLLGGSCNTGLGYYEDNPERLERAAAYIRDFRARRKAA